MRTASTVCLVNVLGKDALSLLVLGVLGKKEVFFLGCSETPTIGGDIWKGGAVGSSKVVINAHPPEPQQGISTGIMAEKLLRR